MSKTNGGNFKQLLRDGTRLLQANQPQAAAELLQQALDLKPNHIETATNLGGAYILMGRHRKAIPILEKAIEEADENPGLWMNLGAAYLGNPILATGERQLKAIDAFKKAAELDPKMPNVFYNIGLIYRDRKETLKAIAMFQKALEANPDDRDAKRIIRRLSRDVSGNGGEA